jgi:hypothetical protein
LSLAQETALTSERLVGICGSLRKARGISRQIHNPETTPGGEAKLPEKKEKALKIPKLIKEKVLTESEKMKYEIAEELGLMDKVKKTGWKSLTAKESGRIGGLMNKRSKKNGDED